MKSFISDNPWFIVKIFNMGDYGDVYGIIDFAIADFELIFFFAFRIF